MIGFEFQRRETSYDVKEKGDGNWNETMLCAEPETQNKMHTVSNSI